MALERDHKRGYSTAHRLQDRHTCDNGHVGKSDSTQVGKRDGRVVDTVASWSDGARVKDMISWTISIGRTRMGLRMVDKFAYFVSARFFSSTRSSRTWRTARILSSISSTSLPTLWRRSPRAFLSESVGGSLFDKARTPSDKCSLAATGGGPDAV